MVGTGRTRWSGWWPFVLLCLVAAGRWLFADTWPGTGSTIASEAAGCGLAALILFALTLLRRRSAAGTAELASYPWRWALAGAFVLVGPAIGSLLEANSISGSDWMIAFALTPVVAAVALPAFGCGIDGIAGRMWPGLASIAGLLLILPQPLLGDVRGDVAMLLAPALMGVGAAIFCGGDASLPPHAASSRSISALSGAALVFGLTLVVGIVRHGSHVEFSPLAALLDAAMAWLGVTVLSRLGTTRWTAQFAIVPLAVMVAGLIGLRPRLDWHWLSGLGLLFVAGVFLLLPPDDGEGEDASALNLG